MKVIIAILALVGAAAANHIPEHAEIEKVMMAAAAPAAARELGVVDDLRMMSVFAAPKFARDAYLTSEKYGIRGLYERPVIVALKNDEKKVMEAFLLKDGLLSAFTMPEYAFMRSAVLSGPAKVGLMLSAARYLDIPEMALPMPAIKMPVDATFATAFRLNSMESDKYPWVFVTEKDNLRASMLDKLVEVGQFSVNAEKLAIAREAPLAARFPTNAAILEESALASALPASALKRAYLADSFEAEPAFEKVSPLSSLSPLGYRIVRTNPYRNYAVATPIATPIASRITSPIATRGEAPIYHVRPSGLEDTDAAAEYGFGIQKHAKQFIPTLSSANAYYLQ